MTIFTVIGRAVVQHNIKEIESFFPHAANYCTACGRPYRACLEPITEPHAIDTDLPFFTAVLVPETRTYCTQQLARLRINGPCLSTIAADRRASSPVARPSGVVSFPPSPYSGPGRLRRLAAAAPARPCYVQAHGRTYPCTVSTQCMAHQHQHFVRLGDPRRPRRPTSRAHRP